MSVIPLSQVMFGPKYSADPPEGHGVSIERAVLSDDKRTLTVEFWGGACFSDVVPWVGRSGEELHVGLFEVARAPANAQPSPLVACVAMAVRRTYHLVLPEPFTGSTVRDLNDGVLVLE